GVRLADADEVLVFALMVVLSPAATATVAWEAVLLDVDQHHLEGELRLREGLGEVDQVVEHVEQHALLGTAAAGDNGATRAVELDDHLAGDDRFDNPDFVRLGQVVDLAGDHPEAAMLDLDQLLAADDIDAVA